MHTYLQHWSTSQLPLPRGHRMPQKSFCCPPVEEYIQPLKYREITTLIALTPTTAATTTARQQGFCLPLANRRWGSSLAPYPPHERRYCQDCRKQKIRWLWQLSAARQNYLLTGSYQVTHSPGSSQQCSTLTMLQNRQPATGNRLHPLR